ncbi:MAG: hypothetical protein FWC27_15410 [Firmicutes bacterium]|nr:hypothetical protein [Bacillota bacterium]
MMLGWSYDTKKYFQGDDKMTPKKPLPPSTKKIAAAILAVFAVLTFSRCTAEPPAGPTAFTALDRFSFSFPPGWKLNEKENPYDLQCISLKDDLVTGVFVIDRRDIAEATTAEDIFALQIDDLRSKRQNFSLVEETKDAADGGRRIKTVVYAGEKDVQKNYYIFSLVEFDDSDEFAVVIQTCFPSAWDEKKAVLEEIVGSCKTVRPTDE